MAGIISGIIYRWGYFALELSENLEITPTSWMLRWAVLVYLMKLLLTMTFYITTPSHTAIKQVGLCQNNIKSFVSLINLVWFKHSLFKKKMD